MAFGKKVKQILAYSNKQEEAEVIPSNLFASYLLGVAYVSLPFEIIQK